METPRLSRVSTRAFGVAGIRLALGVAGIAASTMGELRLRGAILGAVIGAVILVMIALGQSSRANLRGEPEWLPVPPGATYDPPWLGPLLACIPSTLGVAVMIGVALPTAPAMSAILAGVMLALGGLAVASGFEVVARESREGVRLWLGRGPKPARYVAPR